MANVKIMVTELPEYAWECPFSEMGDCIGFHDCKLSNGREHCPLNYGMNCTKLVKGYVTNEVED